MAYDNNQNENALPTPDSGDKTSVNFLPKFFRTEANRKFLQGTIDQLISKGAAEKIDGYVGRKYTSSYKANDNYLEETSQQREDYQLEPTVTIRDNLNNVDFAKDYKDYLNTIKYFGGSISNQDRLNKVDTYSWNPHINWDMITNFREYYWLPNGPLSVAIAGQARDITSTYSVTVEDQGDNDVYIFNDGLTANPKLNLYRGQTYKFEIDTPGHPIAFAIERSFVPGKALLVAGKEGIRSSGLFDAELYGNEYDIGDFVVTPEAGSVTFESAENVSTLYNDGIKKFNEAGNEVAIVYVEKGTITFTIPANAPDRLYYISSATPDTSGLIKVYDIEENTFLNVEQDILDKKTYTSSNNVELTSGMLVNFTGSVSPAKYADGSWYVEGVGQNIKLVSQRDLVLPSAYTENIEIPFDTNNFDVFPYSTANNYPQNKDYIVINRGANDRNPWSRTNRWFHKDVVLKSFELNGLNENLDDNFRAKRPIIEFEAGIKLYNFGTQAKLDIDLIDTKTTDVFSNVQGQEGYIIDNIELAEGMRVLFTNDKDPLVTGKIYVVEFKSIGKNRRVISFKEPVDCAPQDLETVFVKIGKAYAGKTFHYHKNVWTQAQEKSLNNQEPVFDLCCPSGREYADQDIFDGSTFRGTKLFSYKKGTGSNDPELGFPLTYRNIENTGDILFEFNLLTDVFTYQQDDDKIDVSTSIANLKKYKTRTVFNYVNGWNSKPTRFKQYVIRDIEVLPNQLNNFEVDVYDNAYLLDDLTVKVYVNNKLKVNLQDYTLDKGVNFIAVKFNTDLVEGDFVKFKTHSAQDKNENGYYELPVSLERNPLNADLVEFTLGEVYDHVDSIVEELNGFTGVYPGNSNLRDLGNVTHLGKHFVKHEAGLANTLYHLTNKQYNIIKALKYSKRKYATFKTTFIDTATNLGFDGTNKAHVDKVLLAINKDKPKVQPFYFSDMVASGDSNRIEYTIIDKEINLYPLTSTFTLSDLSAKAVLLYLNGTQLVHDRDYTFNDDGFVNIACQKENGDTLEIYEYATTDGSFIPPTPSKLGLYPTWHPEIFIDSTQSNKPLINTAGPFKIYGEVEVGSYKNHHGWFYPLYTSNAAAKSADTAAGGTGTCVNLLFKGLPVQFYIPTVSANYATIDDQELGIEEYPVNLSFVKGHDGSQIKCYKDYRDNLLLELEKRIYNNIKVDYANNNIDYYNFVGGDFRKYQNSVKVQNKVLLTDFIEYQANINESYSTNDYDRNNAFTYNYSAGNNPSGDRLPGYWRKIYINAFDTDRPHSHPWEMLGFQNKPTWWNTVYGPAPYTSNNLVLWEDLELGRIAEPGKEKIVKKWARQNLKNFIPVDGMGQLLPPVNINYIQGFNQRKANAAFEFGDAGPIENSWRRSSEYPFAIINAMLLVTPADIIAKGFDVSRAVKNLAGQVTYDDTGKFIENKNILFPNTYEDTARISTSGLINYVYNLVSSNVLKVYTDYQDNVKQLDVNLSFRLAGFSDKKKLNVILESKSPKTEVGSTGVFVPQENYELVYNESSPIDTFLYSGVIVEKTTQGFKISGYAQNSPSFKYYKPLLGATKYVVAVGGISEEFTQWAPRTVFRKGQIVFYLNTYYRVTDSFTSNQSFDEDNLAKLSALPTSGGRAADFYKSFDTSTTEELIYGTILPDIQSTVDFLLGYGRYLELQGFTFDDVEDNIVNDWMSVTKEFMFWTTQGWANGTIISVSPSANILSFKTEYAVVDNIFDAFYDYNVIATNGQVLERDFNNVIRKDNEFGIKPRDTDLGIYGASLPIIQKEHIIVLDNNTIFNDVIYHPASGYRQQRIKVSGYRSDNWNGSLNIPGFIYDNAIVKEFVSYKDYKIGDLVKYKQYYYVANKNSVGQNDIDFNSWTKLNEKPVPDLITNFDFRAQQFNDFYEPNTASFDNDLHELGSRLVGFQKREFLSNLIVDDVSQFKFYQGMIQEKGTKNAITKLFAPLSNNSQESLEYFEEWGIRSALYGSTDEVSQIELVLSDEDMKISPQPVEFVDNMPSSNFDNSLRVVPSMLIDRPNDWETKFPVIENPKEYTQTSGYVDDEDINFNVGSVGDLALGNVNILPLGGYIHLTSTLDGNWTIYQHTETELKCTGVVEATELSASGKLLYTITFDKWVQSYISDNDIIALRGAEEFDINGFYNVESTELNTATVQVPIDNDIKGFVNQSFTVTQLRKVRLLDETQINDIVNEDLYSNQKIWIDNYNDKKDNWKVVKNEKVFSKLEEYVNPTDWDSTVQDFTGSMTATQDNRNVFVASKGDEAGKIYVYKRTKENANLRLTQVLNFTQDGLSAVESNDDFGHAMDVSLDGEFLAVGMPFASNIKTKLTGDFNSTTAYEKFDIVKYRESFWRANRSILPETGTQSFSTFDSYINLTTQADTDSTNLQLLVAGDFGLTATNTDHILVRAPIDMYIGTKGRIDGAAGDKVNLYWNQRSYAYPTLDNYLPFDGAIPEITRNFINQEHEIIEKIDAILSVDTFVSLPVVGDIITTDTATGEVFYTNTYRDSAVIYLKNVVGILNVNDEAFIQGSSNFIGFYTQESTYVTSPDVGGFWYINTQTAGNAFTYNNNGKYLDIGRGLVFADVRPSTSVRAVNNYNNIQDAVASIGNFVQEKNRASFITQLSYRGNPVSQDGVSSVESPQLSNKWVVRISKEYQDILEAENAFELQGSISNATLGFGFYDGDNSPAELSNTGGIDLELLTSSHQIYDKWDGYIDLTLSEFDASGFAFQPQVGDIIEDVQIPRDGSGGLALTSISTSLAEVKFLQRKFNTVRLYVTVQSGTWTELNNIGKFQIRRKAGNFNTIDPNIRGGADVDRVFGTIDDPDNQIILGNNIVGDLLVFEKSSTDATDKFSIVDNPEILESEYYFFEESIEGGISRAENAPFSLNKDWTQIYNIPADERGTESGLANEGAVAIYRRGPGGTYDLDYILTSQYKFANRKFGDTIKIRKNGNLYTLLVGSQGDLDGSTRSDPGSIEIFMHGASSLDVFKGDYQKTSYDKGDVVIYKDKYYRANKDTNDSIGTNILNPIIWDNISWRYGVDNDYRGVWENTYPYTKGSIVLKDNKFYTAQTNIAGGAAWNTNIWLENTQKIDYLGYLPNLSTAYYGENTFDPATNIIQFSESFDVSENGDVLIVTATVESTDSGPASSKLAIYRKNEEKYELFQIIDSPNDNNGWADNVRLKPDGLQFIVSASYSDTDGITDSGEVYVYTQNNGLFTTTPQTIKSPNRELSERFGSSIAFSDENLFVTSLNGDQKIPTTFDTYANKLEDSRYINDPLSGSLGVTTTFDLSFTEFKNTKIDSGVVYVYENFNDTYTYSDKFRYDNATTDFGKNLLANENHVYVGIPYYLENDNERGIFIDYRKPKNKKSWSTYKEIVLPVDTTLIESVMLYDRKKNAVVSYVDYIDPVQGKIAGIAEQDITFKTNSDPAYYNVGLLSDPKVDANQVWTTSHVGQVWWDISSAKFEYAYQGSTSYQKNAWSKLVDGGSINVYEWVESSYLPSQYTDLSNSEKGIKLGISGQPLYGDSMYSAKLIYDSVAQIFTTKYYFWVKDKRTTPVIKNRNLSIFDIAKLIERPREQGYRYISFISKDKMILNNFENVIKGDDIVLNIKYRKQLPKNTNTHSQFKLLADGDPTSRIDEGIERKWHDSLVGFDTNYRHVPDNKIPVQQRYGILNRPRQSMFVNRTEALKQTVERLNYIFANNLIVDDYNISALLQKEAIPTPGTNEFDVTIDTYEELQFVSTNNIKPAKLTPILNNGKLIRVDITDPGRGYKTPPSFELSGGGTDATIDIKINNLGSITSVKVTSQGKNYIDSQLIVRRFSVLVKADSTTKNNWSVYGYNEIDKTFFKRKTQSYDVTKYWDYKDWYAEGFNQFTNINHQIDSSYQLQQTDIQFNDIVKIKDIGTSGWLLLKRTGLTNAADYTRDYLTIGRQNGTLEFKASLYDTNTSVIGYDNRTFDSGTYDNFPAQEIRIILEALRDNILINNLAVEYNQLFFASLRYIVAEQRNIDWMFKTSFIKINHKLGSLAQPATFKNDNLQYFEDYVKEIKPYSSNIREFISTYDKVDDTNTAVTDFDAAPVYNTATKQFETLKSIVQNGKIVINDQQLLKYPTKYFTDNAGAEITEIKIKDSGSGYIFAPKVIIENANGATAEAFIGYGKVTAIILRNPGGKFITPPKVSLEGSQIEGGTPAKVYAILGNSVVRTPTIKVKFDRVAKDYYIQELSQTETFTASGVDTIYNLKWPMDTKLSKVKVFVNEIEMLRSTYTYKNIEKIDGHTFEYGQVVFTKPQASGSNIRIEYYKPLSFLQAPDRILAAYAPTDGMFGKELNQLMTGIDYGGVEIKSFDFGGIAGYDSQPWFTDTWDTYENTFEDEVFTSDGSTIAVQLQQPLENGVKYNVYKNNVKIDAEDWIEGEGSSSNLNAIMATIIGDGTTDIIYTQDLGIVLEDGDVFIVRKITSDGSVIPDLDSYDTQLEGGDLNYTTAAGINAEEIITDGDLFVSSTRAQTEELIAGSVQDTLDIKVYTKESGGQGLVTATNYTILSDSTLTHTLQLKLGSKDSVLIQVDGVILDNTQYTLDWAAKTVTLPVTQDQKVCIIEQEQSTTAKILYIGEQTVQVDEQSEFIIDYEYADNLSVSVSINGEMENVELFDYSQVIEGDNRIGFRLDNAATIGQVINWSLFTDNSTVNFSQVIVDEFTAGASQTTYTLGQAPFYSVPTEHNIIVRVGQQILNSGYSKQFTIPEGNQREYQLELFQQPLGSISADTLKVFLNGQEIFTPEQWRIDIANSSVLLSDEYGLPGDVLEVYNLGESEYSITGKQITLANAPAQGESVYVHQFSNHDLKNIEKIQYDIVQREQLITDTEEGTYAKITSGEIPLRNPAIDAQYVWVTKNGILLTPSVDYYLHGDRKRIQLVKIPLQNDVIEVIHFAAKVSEDGFSYRQFKDILNRTHFKRLDQAAGVLANPLNQTDLRITLSENGSDIPEPDKGKNLPGVIFINGERIEYFVKENNILRQIRRGTLGTGVPTVHAAGTKIYNQNREKTIPYKDENLVRTITADGITNQFSIGFEVASINEIEVFAAGKRLNKQSITLFNPTLAPNSPAGDETLPAEFSIDSISNRITLLATPTEDSRITIIKKTGRSWVKDGEQLGDAETSISRFLRAGSYEQPE